MPASPSRPLNRSGTQLELSDPLKRAGLKIRWAGSDNYPVPSRSRKSDRRAIVAGSGSYCHTLTRSRPKVRIGPFYRGSSQSGLGHEPPKTLRQNLLCLPPLATTLKRFFQLQLGKVLNKSCPRNHFYRIFIRALLL